MNCPSCNTQLKDKDLICPKCKKVVRLQCPECKHITKKTICEKCGSVILNKCYKCGKLNSTAQSKCPQCGLDINASIGLRESIIEEFAVLTIEITNFEDFKSAFKSDTLTKQFKQNLFSLIQKTGQQKQLRVQFIDNTFIIRFCKDTSFKESCYNAIDFAIYVAQTVTQINKKLFQAKGITLKTQMAIQKRDVYAKTSEYKSGININVVYSTSGASHLFNNIELVADSFVYQETKEKFPYQSLSAMQIKNRMIMFFELILHKVVDLEEETKSNKTSTINLPQNLNYEPEEEKEDENLITFKSLNCSFLRAKSDTLLQKLSDIAKLNVTNPIISIKTTKRNNILPLIKSEDLEKVFEDTKLCYITSTANDKYTPYGLLKSIYIAYQNVSEIELLTNNLVADAITTDKDILNLLKSQSNANQHPEDIKFAYYEAFGKFFEKINDKTLFVITDFENADETSIEIIKYLFEKKQLGQAGFLMTNEQDFSVHRKIYKLMTSSNYFEIEMRPTSNKNVLSENLKKINKIKESFFIEKIIENTKGSNFYFSQALDYLVDNNILKLKDNQYEILNDNMIVIPKSLNELVQKRLSNLKQCNETFELYGSMLFIGSTMPTSIIEKLNIKNTNKIIKTLEEQNFIELTNDNKIAIKNYNLYKSNFIEICDEQKFKNIAKLLKENIYQNTETSNVSYAELSELCNEKKEAFKQWHSLAILSNELGDFCAYFNNTNKFLSLVDNVVDEEIDKNVDQIKIEVYSEMASMLYKYYPEKTLNYLDLILNYLEKQNDNTQITEIANKLVQSCIISGNYNNALEYIGKIISRTPKSSFNPKDKSFNINYYLINLVTLEIYFNLGRLNECIELGEELFKYVSFENASNEDFLKDKVSKKEFCDAVLDGLFFVNTARIIQLTENRKTKISELIEQSEKKHTCFELLQLINEFLANKDISSKLLEIKEKGFNDKYSLILFPILQALTYLKNENWESFGNYIYNAKLKARAYEQHQINYFCDLMIGYAYLQKNNITKSKEIFYSVLDTASEKGLKNIMILGWYLIAIAEYKDNKKAISLDIINKTMLKIEKDTNSSNFFLLIYKLFFAQTNIELNTEKALEEATVCAQQAYTIAINNDILVNLSKIANTLIHLYSIARQNTSDANIKLEFENKIKNIQNTIQNIIS